MMYFIIFGALVLPWIPMQYHAPCGKCFQVAVAMSSQAKLKESDRQNLTPDRTEIGQSVNAVNATWQPGCDLVLFDRFDLMSGQTKTIGKLFLFGSPFYLCTLFLVQNCIRVWVAMQLYYG